MSPTNEQPTTAHQSGQPPSFALLLWCERRLASGIASPRVGTDAVLVADAADDDEWWGTGQAVVRCGGRGRMDGGNLCGEWVE